MEQGVRCCRLFITAFFTSPVVPFSSNGEQRIIALSAYKTIAPFFLNEQGKARTIVWKIFDEVACLKIHFQVIVNEVKLEGVDDASKFIYKLEALIHKVLGLR